MSITIKRIPQNKQMATVTYKLKSGLRKLILAIGRINLSICDMKQATCYNGIKRTLEIKVLS